MLVLVPAPSIDESTAIFSPLDLYRNIAAVVDLLEVLHETHPNWEVAKGYPTVKMWRGHEVPLCLYGMAMCDRAEVLRGDDYIENIRKHLDGHFEAASADAYNMKAPSWMGNTSIHASHISWLMFCRPLDYDHLVNAGFKMPTSQPRLVWPAGVVNG